MACLILHSLCIRTNDSCKPRWKLPLEELNVGNVNRQQNKRVSN